MPMTMITSEAIDVLQFANKEETIQELMKYFQTGKKKTKNRKKKKCKKMINC